MKKRFSEEQIIGFLRKAAPGLALTETFSGDMSTRPHATRRMQEGAMIAPYGGHMRVMVLIKASPQSEAGRLPSEQLVSEMARYTTALDRAGVLLAGEGLRPSGQGRRLRFTAREQRLSEGPFSATGELLAGFWLWRVSSMEEAVAWARRCPVPEDEHTELELRPLFEPDDFNDLLDLDRHPSRPEVARACLHAPTVRSATTGLTSPACLHTA